ncbi:glycerol acyltransferase [Mucilaginibacter limnophilus]|uniref:Glycerol acyltransferase n=1 Tax=Mucilaginibacter limnophilus TaxID=1932778 RepID=A0A3S2V6E9_9SPHI|nr:lysophospholipid acyltransferase family protein [Mucilaginibacter limnophilus]RVT98263.1 glycerol acyltransferase [Mucilaginibacter limnophilus]
MITTRKNKLIEWFFHWYIIKLVDGNFSSFNFNQVKVDNRRSVLLLANHFSWWDGFVLYYLNQKIFKKRFHIMILEETVRKVFFFKYLGAFSISKNSRDMLASLNYAADLLKNPDNLVLIFPQGKLYSNFVDEVYFEKGIQRVIEKAGKNTQVVFAATFIENFGHKKPGINVYLQNNNSNFATLDELSAAYAQHYSEAKQQQTQISI